MTKKHPSSEEFLLEEFYHNCNLEEKTYHFQTINALVSKTVDWFSKTFKTKFPYEKLDLVFVSDYINVATSHPGVISIKNNFIDEETTDILDWSYFKVLVVNGM